MKKNILTLLAFVAFHTGAQAQEAVSVAQFSPPSEELTGYASKGTRLMVTKPFIAYEMVQDIDGTKQLSTYDSSSAVGVSLGYVHLPIRELGWTADLAGITLGDNFKDQYTVRLAGNIATALRSNFFVKSGVNLSQTTGEKVINGIATETSPGLGFQTGVGYQLSQTFGFEAGFSWMNQKTNVSGELFQQAAEIGVTGTF